MINQVLDYLPYQYLRKAKRCRSGRLAVLGQAVKSAGVRNGNVALFSKIRQCALQKNISAHAQICNIALFQSACSRLQGYTKKEVLHFSHLVFTLTFHGPISHMITRMCLLRGHFMSYTWGNNNVDSKVTYQFLVKDPVYTAIIALSTKNASFAKSLCKRIHYCN